MGDDAYGMRPFVNPDSLHYAARLVYDHCKRVGLKPYVYREIPEGQKECLLTLKISWDNPAASQREYSARNRPPIPLISGHPFR
jgi:hypothetical protein